MNQAASDEAVLKTISLLYVEDDELIRTAFGEFLKRRVGRLYTAENGQEGLAQFQRYRPDVVVTDIMMPVVGGLDMAADIKKINPFTPVIVTTAFNEADFFLRAIDIGVDKYVIKPVQTPLLIDALIKCAFQVRADAEMRLSRTVFETSSEAIMVTDGQNHIVAVNAAFSDVTGYTRGEVLGLDPRFMNSGRHDEGFFQGLWKSLTENGRWSGEIWNRRKNGEIYPEWMSVSAVKDRLGKVTHYVTIFTDITERKEAEERVRHLAHYDALTDLPNRTLFYDRLSQALIQAQRDNTLAAVMFIDLDRFKNINDTLGHSVGDLLLQGVAERLIQCMRQGDSVSRQGGDEFVVLLPAIGQAEDAAVVAQKILESIGKPFFLDEHELHVTCSIGISFYPNDGDNSETLMKNADTAMYRAKEAGRGNYQFYLADMNARSLERLAMETSMRFAIEREQFELYYQPQIDVAGGTMVGAEALIRWNHPTLGMVLPAHFIPLAEETGLIQPIGEWVLRTACRQAARWQSQGYASFLVSVNVSARQFRQAGFVDMVASALRDCGLPPECLELELTESVLMGQTDKNIAILRSLKQMGLTIAIDDFGTGYSSLNYLKRLPIDTLKVDRSFVGDLPRDKDDAAIVDAVVSMAHSLSLKVVAEGVETEDQVEFLRSRRCYLMQGFYFYEALPAAELTRLLEEGGIVRTAKRATPQALLSTLDS